MLIKFLQQRKIFKFDFDRSVYLRCLKLACYEFYCILSKDWKKNNNNINVLIGKILGLIATGGDICRDIFFFSIAFERILILRDTLSDSVETQRLLLFSNLLSSVFPSVFYHSVFS